MFLKAKIVFKNPKNCSLVIFDGESIADLKNVLSKYNYFVLQNRIELIDTIYLSFRIINLCFKNYKGNIMSAYLISLLEIISPKVVFTFIDNSFKFSEIAKSLEKKMKFLALQQGARYDFKENKHLYQKKITNFNWNKIFFIPNLLCVGQFDINNYKRYNIKVGSFKKVGSLRLSNFLTQIKKKPINSFKKIYDIALISDTDAWDPRLDSEILKKKVILLTKYCIRFSRKHDMRLVLALKREPKSKKKQSIENFQKEQEFYKNYLTTSEYNFILKRFHFKTNKFVSYKIMLKSKIVVGTISTMLRENLAIGGKILACNLTPGNLYNFPFDGICSIKNCTYEDFEKRLLYIFSISKKNYFSQLSKNRNYTVYYNKNHSTIEIVKKELDLLLN